MISMDRERVHWEQVDYAKNCVGGCGTFLYYS